MKGNCYIGEFFDGLFSGKGRYFFKNGDLYDGEWANNKFHSAEKVMSKFVLTAKIKVPDAKKSFCSRRSQSLSEAKNQYFFAISKYKKEFKKFTYMSELV